MKSKVLQFFLNDTGENFFNKLIYGFLRIFLAVFFICGVIYSGILYRFLDKFISIYDPAFDPKINKVSLFTFLIFVLYFLFCILIYVWLSRPVNPEKPQNRKFTASLFQKIPDQFFVGAVIFLIAFLPRILFISFSKYLPTNDFENYFMLGRNFFSGDFPAVADMIDTYSLPSFAGLSVLNGIIGFIFTSTVLGFQIANCIMTSFICVLVYSIAKKIGRNVGILAALLFAAYPVNIAYVCVLTNQHGSILFLLLSFDLFLKCMNGEINIRKSVVLACLAGLSLLIGNMFHPSAIISFIAMTFFTILYILNHIFKNNYHITNDSDKKHDYYKKSSLIKASSTLVIVAAVYFILNVISIHLFLNLNMLHSAKSSPAISKIVVGLNTETYGSFSSDYEYIASFPEETQHKICAYMIKNRIRSNDHLTGFLAGKIASMWYTSDKCTAWAIDGAEKYLREHEYTPAGFGSDPWYIRYKSIISGVTIADYIFVTFAYLFAFLSVLNKKLCGNINLNFLTWLLCGWIGIHIISEVQTRYRYFGMPIIFIFSAIGVVYMIEAISSTRHPSPNGSSSAP